ncbi:MAG: hypothetical protein M1816_002261 [Peltula sp. TS41687]|nr:MAG: hypothetical protein M1816_002261 [Peltula sp. TS41687]
MPEIGEIARLVHYLRKHLVGKVIKSVKVQEDNIVYGKAGTTAVEFQKAMTGKRVLEAQQQGKYFWLIMSSPPHPLFHAGMTGWVRFSSDDTSFYKPIKKEDNEWPPKFWKFILVTDEQPPCEAAFIDPRRLGRIRLLDCAGEKMRQTPPLSENGPDPVLDKHILTREWFADKLRRKKVPVKAFLLDQANISGVGNWVGYDTDLRPTIPDVLSDDGRVCVNRDEILWNSRIHPEQYTNSLSDEQLHRLHRSLMQVCEIAVSTLADSDQFPEDWLMKYRWGKGKKKNQLPTGEKITYVKVGGRTSAVVPSLQKKTGPVAGDVEGYGDTNETKNEDSDNANGSEGDESKVKQKRKRQDGSEGTETDEQNASSKKGRNKRIKAEERVVKNKKTTSLEKDLRQGGEAKSSTSKGPGRKKGSKSTAEAAANEKTASSSRRRSARISSRPSK